jgi:hypothetical protein
MKTIYYKVSLLILIFIGGIQFLSAQKFEKKYHESFKVNKDVVISLNTYYTDVVIENWNKNTVDISAKITVEGDSLKQEDANKYFENWHFEAIGNSEKIRITGRNNRFGGLYENLVLREIAEVPEFPEMPEMPEISIVNLDILDSFKYSFPVLNNIKMDSMSFNFEAYKKDKNYLKKFQKKAQLMAKKIRLKMLKDTVARKKRVVEMKKVMAKMKVEMAKHKKEFAKQRQEMLLHQKDLRVELRTAAKKIRAVLVKRNKVKLKKTIYIKVPKGAKFNMNVSYGSVKFPS